MSDIVGTIATKGTMRGSLNVVYGKDGESAYELALLNGFEGTEEEWLASLKGEQGNPGIYIGSGDMPEGYNVQIDPDGDAFELSAIVLDGIAIADTATGKKYSLAIKHSKLTLTEVDEGTPTSNFVLTDTETNKKYNITINNSKLTLTEVE